nr:hypothetical protein BaRGS_026523 [Batillaria attramentaria]
MDYDELLNDWRSLHDYMSRNARSDFEQFVKLLPDSETGVSDLSLSGMTSEVVGVYRRLHGYVRGELQKLVGPHRMPSTGHIPAHLVDVTDGSGWEHVLPDVLPFKHNFNFHTISRKVSNVSDMLEMVESFLDSLGVDNLTSVWQQRSVLTQPPGDTTILCEPPTVTNLYQSNDYRVVACLDVDEWGMRSAVELVYQLKAVQALDDKPFIMKDTSEDFVDAALGGALALAFSTPAHLKVTGLYDVSVNISEEDEINFLLDVALSQLPPLVMSNVTSGWQSRVLGSQRSSPTRIWNSAWWSLRCEQEGVSPPVTRTTVDFDAGASSSVLSNVPGQRLVKTVIAQFQILKSLCQKAGDRGRLAFCNIRDSKDVRNTIRAALGQIGSSQKLRELIGTDHLDAGPMLHYLKPLTLWLDEHLSTSENEWNPACPDPHTGKVRDSQAVQMFLDRYNMEGQKVWTTSAELSWALDTNITDYNQQAKVNYSLTESKFEKESAWEAAMFDGEHLDNAAQQRMIRMISDIGTDALRDEGKVKRLNEVLTSMTEIYNTATVCLTPKFNNCVPLDPDITRLMAKSRNYSELSDAWRLWRDATGRKLRGLYEEFVQLSNEGIQELGYEDTGDAWRSYYEDDTFQEELQALLNQLHPVYQQLHTYVRKRLMDFYGEDKFPSTGHIPAHILGNMWAQQWNNILDLVVPYPNKESVDVTDEMVKQNYTAHSMFEVAEEFYTSLGLSPMPERFWNKSMIERPADGRQVVCHASAWNFFNGKDFRIKMCTDITMEDLITIHHEMGHIQYYLQYKDQPIVFQSGANPGFHEAIGDVMGLSVATPKHLHKINLLKSAQQDNEADMNFLLKTALEKIAFLPFGYLIDQWRWSVFAGDTTPRDYNSRWWDLRCKYQGISPPVDRSEVDFDPGAKFHVPDNTPYIRYFVSFVMQFTFYKRLCEVANHTGPLHRCDFYQSREAGAVFKDMLQKGASKPWQDVLEDFNGQRSMNASAIIEFFQPLTEWLAEQNAGLPAGWTDACPPGSTKKILDESLARSWLQQYDEEAKQVAYETAVLEWNYATNITDNNQQAQVEGDLKFAQWEQKKAVEAARYDWRHLADDDLVRQFRSATDIGTSAMKNTTKLKQMGELQSSIEGIYAKAKVCANDTYCLELEPDLTRLLATSRDYNELLWAWEGWRNMTGPLMKDSYAKFVTLSNEAVQNLGYNDTGEYWRSWYESDTFQSDLEALLEQLSPLYQQLHAYVRRKLNEVYGADKFPYSGHIPAHLLGNMWAQEWNNLYDLVRPFANKSATDVTPELVKQGYTVEKMFSTSEDFYKSLGLEPMPISFWRDSMMEKPEDRDVVCHASAWDFSSGQDYRIKMCTDITMEDLITIHHEMGHIQYYLQYRHQPYLFQSGANPGTYEI